MNAKIIIFALTILFLFGNTTCSAQEKKGEKSYSSSKIYEESVLTKKDSISNELYNSRQNAITRAVAKASPAVVGINVIQYVEVPVETYDPFMDPFFEFFFGGRPRDYFYERYQVRGLGSGFIISPDGYILTNHHVAGNASKIVVTTTEGKKYDAKLIAADELTDVALLKIEGDNFPYLKLGNSDDVIVGEWVIAMGNPFGLFDLNMKPTVTVGVVSNKGINIIQENRVYKGLIQTDAAISSGNSGGPLLNSLGEVIGINTMIYSTATSREGAGSIGIGWAIPINRVKKLLDRVSNNIELKRNWDIGITLIEPNSIEARRLYLKFDEGLLVTEVYRNSPAAKAGFEPGDIILEINGEKVNSLRDYRMIVFDSFIGDDLNFKVKRGDRIIDLVVKVQKYRRR
ncbi:PDZ domain-containing protein [Bacteroidetes/Chlorobi group bacterium Naka2016]|jgi:serine protease Do|nr:MAG: PDZ domain-containing protein [Bacteroidetes/Chlorobi group bacterium Naka2016]